MPEFNYWSDPDWEKGLFTLHRLVPERFTITHYDASIFIDELAEACHAVGLRVEYLHGVEAAFVTNDVDKVKQYKSRVCGWGWQLLDKANGTFTEADFEEGDGSN